VAAGPVGSGSSGRQIGHIAGAKPLGSGTGEGSLRSGGSADSPSANQGCLVLIPGGSLPRLPKPGQAESLFSLSAFAERRSTPQPGAELSTPQLFEPRRIGRGVLDGVLNVPVAEIILNEPCIRALVGKREAASVAEHVRMG
jgi:hypothetical protein